jgi:hypothetical protein
MLAVAGPSLAAAITAFAEEAAYPTVVHCVAGKDRTGLFVAFLLSAIGGRPDPILADSDVLLAGAPAALLDADVTTLQAVFADVDDGFGSTCGGDPVTRTGHTNSG